MNNRNKKKIAVILVLVIVLVCLAVYLFFFNKQTRMIDPNEGDQTGFNFPSFFPFNIGNNGGQNKEPVDITKNSNGSGLNNPVNEKKDRLFQVTKIPSISSPLYEKNKINYARYIESTTGNIYEIDFSTRNNKRISNKTISGIVDASWSGSGKKLIGKQYTKDGLKNIGFDIIESGVSTSSDSQVFSAIRIFNVDENLLQAVFEPKTEKYFSLIQTGAGVEGYLETSSLDRKKIFESPFSEWILNYTNKDTFILTSKVTSGTYGYMYKIDPLNGSLSKIVGAKKGLVTLSNPDGTKVLYSESSSDTFNTYILDNRTGSTTKTIFTTLPDKCTWKNNDDVLCAVPVRLENARYPDDWYKGKILFTDKIFLLGTKLNTLDLISEPLIEKDVQIDGINLQVSSDGKILIFKNKRDLSLWAVDLNIELPETSEEPAVE